MRLPTIALGCARCTVYIRFCEIFYFVMFVLSFLCLLAWLAHVSILPIEHITLEYKLTHSMHFGCFYLLLDYTKRPVTKETKNSSTRFFVIVATYYFYFFSVLLFRLVSLFHFICREWAREVLFGDREVCYSRRIWDENTEKALVKWPYRNALHKMAGKQETNEYFTHGLATYGWHEQWTCISNKVHSPPVTSECCDQCESVWEWKLSDIFYTTVLDLFGWL